MVVVLVEGGQEMAVVILEVVAEMEAVHWQRVVVVVEVEVMEK